MGFHKLLANCQGCVIQTTKGKQVLKTEQQFDNRISIISKYILIWFEVQTIWLLKRMAENRMRFTEMITESAVYCFVNFVGYGVDENLRKP